MIGVITKIIPAKGFGFIRGIDDGQPRFFHVKEVLPPSAFDTMHEGQKVSFTPIDSDKGNKLRAVEVRSC